jgi:hypothetical protein
MMKKWMFGGLAYSLVYLQGCRVENVERLSLLVCILAIGGCVYIDGSTLVTGPTRTALDPTEVKLYLDAPSDYEIIGVVSATGNGWTEQESQDLAIEELKKRAANVGANGILLTITGEQTPGTVGAISQGHFSVIPDTTKKVSGKAIHVKQ